MYAPPCPVYLLGCKALWVVDIGRLATHGEGLLVVVARLAETIRHSPRRSQDSKRRRREQSPSTIPALFPRERGAASVLPWRKLEVIECGGSKSHGAKGSVNTAFGQSLGGNRVVIIDK